MGRRTTVATGMLAAMMWRAQAAAVDDDLLAAAKYGNRPAAEVALRGGACAGTRDSRGFTPLMWAAAAGSADVVRLLLSQGADVNSTASNGYTALLGAAANGHTSVLRLLLAKQPALADYRVAERTPLKAALAAGHADAAALLAGVEAVSTTLVRAAASGDAARVREALGQGADINYSAVLDTEVGTALAFAVKKAHSAVVKLLTQAGAGQRNEQLLLAAAQNGQTARLMELLCRGVDADDRIRASAERYPEARKLLQAGNKWSSVLPGDAVQDVRRSIAGAKAALPGSPAAARAYERASRAADGLMAQLRNWWQQNRDSDPRKWMARDYIETLENDSAQLDRAVKNGNAGDIVRALELVADDLETKVEHCVKSGNRLATEVNLSVHTLRGGVEVRDLQILYLNGIFQFAKDARPDAFPGFSSPTSESVPAGRYWMWWRDPKTQREGARTEVKVGEGKTALRVDIAVP